MASSSHHFAWGGLNFTEHKVTGEENARKKFSLTAHSRASIVGNPASMEHYKMHLTGKSKGAPIPKGLDEGKRVQTKMDFTLDKYVETAWHDLEKHGHDTIGNEVVDRRRARRFLRCMGWCGTDHELDAMLYGPDPFGILGHDHQGKAYEGGLARSSVIGGLDRSSVRLSVSPAQELKRVRVKGVPERYWTLEQLCTISENGSRNNGSVNGLTAAITALAGDKEHISKMDLQQLLALEEMGLSEEAFMEMTHVLQIEEEDPVPCSKLAEKILQTICRPPDALELMGHAHAAVDASTKASER
jgi:hypothetical protein